MSFNKDRSYSKFTPGKLIGEPLVLLVLQIIALVFLMRSVYFTEFSGGDAAGVGLEKGLHGLFITVPLFIFVQVANFFFVFKAKWHWLYKMFGGTSFLVLCVWFWLIT